MGSDREAADSDGEDFRRFLESMLDPCCAIARAFAQQEGATDAAGDAVIPTGYRGVDEVRASHCHGWDLLGGRRNLPRLMGFVNVALHVLGLRPVESG